MSIKIDVKSIVHCTLIVGLTIVSEGLVPLEIHCVYFVALACLEITLT